MHDDPRILDTRVAPGDDLTASAKKRLRKWDQQQVVCQFQFYHLTGIVLHKPIHKVSVNAKHAKYAVCQEG